MINPIWPACSVERFRCRPVAFCLLETQSAGPLERFGALCYVSCCFRGSVIVLTVSVKDIFIPAVRAFYISISVIAVFPWKCEAASKERPSTVDAHISPPSARRCRH